MHPSLAKMSTTSSNPYADDQIDAILRLLKLTPDLLMKALLKKLETQATRVRKAFAELAYPEQKSIINSSADIVVQWVTEIKELHKKLGAEKFISSHSETIMLWRAMIRDMDSRHGAFIHIFKQDLETYTFDDAQFDTLQGYPSAIQGYLYFEVSRAVITQTSGLIARNQRANFKTLQAFYNFAYEDEGNEQVLSHIVETTITLLHPEFTYDRRNASFRPLLQDENGFHSDIWQFIDRWDSKNIAYVILRATTADPPLRNAFFMAFSREYSKYIKDPTYSPPSASKFIDEFESSEEYHDAMSKLNSHKLSS